MNYSIAQAFLYSWVAALIGDRGGALDIQAGHPVAGAELAILIPPRW